MTFPLLALGVAALALLVLAAAGPAHRLGMSLPAAFTLLRWGSYVGVVAAILGLVIGLLSYRQRQRIGAAVAFVALITGLVAFGGSFQWLRRAGNAPPIHDITTDLENPPAFDAIVPLRAEAPNTLDRAPDLAERQRTGYPDLEPVTLPLQADQVFDRALAVAQARGWAIVTADKATGRIEATDTTRWFGFEDDVVVRLTPWGTGTRVDVRSVSRVGPSDFGTNARRIRDFLDALSES